ncbi:MAG: hypothetical protein WKF94_18210 [Solirubrobacteraceae bacterium]
MRIARNIAALVALGTVGFAAGDFATHPNALGALGLIALLAAFGFLLSHLFRPARAPKPASEPKPPREREERKRPAPVWSGWDAEEAQVAREQRREHRRD